MIDVARSDGVYALNIVRELPVRCVQNSKYM